MQRDHSIQLDILKRLALKEDRSPLDPVLP